MLNNFFIELILALWLLLPAALANGIPPIMSVILPHLDFPMDFHLRARGKRLFGEHKTIRGLVSGTVLGLIIWQIQSKTNIFPELNNILPWYYGALTGCGALIGDALKSFFKRQLDINPGIAWIPFDQIDWIVAHLFILSIYMDISLNLILVSILTGFVLHIAGRLFGYIIGVNKQKI